MNEQDQLNVRDERKAPSYTHLDNYIIDSMSFEKPIDKLLYISLCRFSHMKAIYPSIGKLMLMCGIGSPNTLKAALKRLEGLRLIKVIDRGRKENGEHNTHEYILKEVPEEIINNSVFKEEKVQEKKQVLKNVRKEKSVKTKHNAHVKARKEGVEKGTSNFDGGLSNFDGGSSNFEQENQELTNQELTNKNLKENHSILDKIKELELDIPEPVFKVLKKKEGRLIDSHIDLLDIELIFKEYRNQVNQNEFASILNTVLGKSFKHFKSYLTAAVNRFIENREKKAAGNNGDHGDDHGPEENSYIERRFDHLDFSKRNDTRTPFEEAQDNLALYGWEALPSEYKKILEAHGMDANGLQADYEEVGF